MVIEITGEIQSWQNEDYSRCKTRYEVAQPEDAGLSADYRQGK